LSGSVAQLVERPTENRKVTGSIPVGATKTPRILDSGGFVFSGGREISGASSLSAAGRSRRGGIAAEGSHIPDKPLRGEALDLANGQEPGD
jgi:hypothetical protein